MRSPTLSLPPVQRLLPPNFDLAAHLAAHPPNFRPFHPDYLVQVLHLVGERLADRKLAATAEAPPDRAPTAAGKQRRRGFASLNASRLQKFLRNYRAYLDYLVATHVLEEDPRYSNGRYCRAFRFAAPYRRPAPGGGPGQLVTVSKLWLLRALQVQRQQPGTVTAEKSAQHAGLLGWLDPRTTPLRIDAAAARAAAEALYHQRQQTPEPKLTRRGVAYQRPRYKDAALQYRQDLLYVGRLEERDLRPGFDRQGRLYTALAGMSKRMRQYVSAENYGQLVSLDIRNSQPFICNLLLQSAFLLPPEAVPPERLTLVSHGGEASRQLLQHDPGLVERLRRLLANAPPDVAEFGAWTSGGQFYERLQAALAAAEPERVQPRSREALKGLLLGILYGRLDHQLPAGLVREDTARRAARQVFATALPTVSAVLDEYKRHRHELLPLLLQTLEAELVLGVVAQRISLLHSNIPLFSIHDALVTPSEHADQIEALMRQELKRAVGYEPQIGRTVYSPKPG